MNGCIAWTWMVALAALIAAGGCASSNSAPTDPNAAFTAPDASVRDQMAAVAALASDLHEGRIEKAPGRESLKRIAWRRSAPNNVRLAAIDELLRNDPADTARMLSLMLPTETDWEVIGRICELAADEGWEELAPALVRSWSRPVIEPTDENRPERHALMALFPEESLESVVYRVFSQPQEGASGDRARTEAWALLQRIDYDGDRTRSLLSADTNADLSDPLMADLHAGARELRVTPRTAEQLAWLRDLRKAEHRPFWEASRDAIEALNDAQLEGFALRHVSAVHWAAAHEPDWLKASREELISRFASENRDAARHQRTDGYVDFTGDQRETLTAWGDRLSWGDAVLLLIAKRVMADEALATDLFEQATRDQGDRSTEHGGVIDASGSGFIAIAYPPRPTQRVGDTRFVASSEMLEGGAASLFHYHFHAQRIRNEVFAGPGHGDLEYADRFGRGCLVFTFVSNDALNVDYYQPGGARLDLGEIRRPR